MKRCNMVGFRIVMWSWMLLLAPSAVDAQNPLDSFVNHPAFRSANISVLVRDLKSGCDLFSHRPTHATIPASTMKIVTAATALELLGSDFHFETLIQYDGTICSKGVLNGNIYIVGSGDPTIGSSIMGDRQFLTTWMQAIRHVGITHINGKIIADESRFDNEGPNARWTWDNIGNYFAPGIYALAFNDNTLRVTFNSGAVGSTPQIVGMSPEVEGLTIENNLVSSRITFDSAYFYGAPRHLARQVRGEIPANRPAFVVRAELPIPGLQLARELHRTLNQIGVMISGSPESLWIQQTAFNQPTMARHTIHTHFSPPLTEIINEVNQESNNFYSEQLFKSLALTRHRVATNQHARQVVRQYWRSKGLDITQLFQEDGSGLTPSNAVSAQFFVDLLQYMHQQSPHRNAFFQSLAIAGRTGTLAGILKNTPLEGNVFAKSGSISRVRAYAGFMMHNQNEWAFAILVNNSGVNSRQTLSKIERLLVEMAAL